MRGWLPVSRPGFRGKSTIHPRVSPVRQGAETEMPARLRYKNSASGGEPVADIAKVGRTIDAEKITHLTAHPLHSVVVEHRGLYLVFAHPLGIGAVLDAGFVFSQDLLERRRLNGRMLFFHTSPFLRCKSRPEELSVEAHVASVPSCIGKASLTWQACRLSSSSDLVGAVKQRRHAVTIAQFYEITKP